MALQDNQEGLHADWQENDSTLSARLADLLIIGMLTLSCGIEKDVH